MEAPSPSDILLFGQFRLDRRGGGLFRCDDNGSPVPVAIGSRALEVLGVLAERHGELVSKDEIMTAVWPGMAVEEANLTVQISALRRVLDSGRPDPSCIQTVPGRGYRLTATVTRQAARPRDPQAPAAATAPAATGLSVRAAPPTRRRRAMSMAVGGALAAVVVVGGVWKHGETPASRPAADSPADRRLSVIVLPFENASGDPAQDRLAADITRDVTDVVSQRHVLLVPAATAALYRGGPIDLDAIGRKHDVRFALTGSARRLNGRIIVVASLHEIDAKRPVWSQRFDRSDEPDAPLRIAWLVEERAGLAAVEAEYARALREHPGNLDKRDLMFGAQRAMGRGERSKESDLAALVLIERALALDPDYIWALRAGARVRARLVLEGSTSPAEADLDRAQELIDHALALDPTNALTLRDQAYVLRAQGRIDEAAALLRRGIQTLPRQAIGYFELGTILLMQGRYEEALQNLLTAQRLAEGTDASAAIGAVLALGWLVNDRHAEAIEQARLAIKQTHSYAGFLAELPWLTLIAAESASGRDDDARADLDAFLATPRRLGAMSDIEKRPEFATSPKLLDSLRRAGVPER